MKIALIIEGKTEKAFLPTFRNYLSERLKERMPRIVPMLYDGPIPKEDKLKRVVINLLKGKRACDHVIALTDVYTGLTPPEFSTAIEAKRKMSHWVGDEPRFHPHAAQHDFEAWLLPYWPTIQTLAQHNRAAPIGNPEEINHNRPPSKRISEIFEIGKCRDSYVKPRDASRILRTNHLSDAIEQCTELKALANTILTICGASPIA